MITVERFRVGFFYREEKKFENDSGWRFLSGREDDQYWGKEDNFEKVDVNFIANCDPDIVELLDKPIGSIYGRNPAVGNRFVEMNEEEETK
jgi:hypothetical protein